jgi:ABC-type nitrate/sulfonate/bicarbonate transport system ATPase subunit
VTQGVAEQPKIELRDVQRVFDMGGGEQVVACTDIGLHVGAGEFVSIVGPSGCGKSTIFNVIAGLIEPTRGEALIDGHSVVGSPGQVGYMLQKDLLLPWRTIIDNVVLGAELLGQNKTAVRKQALALMADFGLEGFENAWPARLSGGMKQRAALMRTVLSGRDVLLLDEPFAALDAMTRLLMHEWMLSIWEEFGRTIVFITHDVDEAIFLSDRVYVMTARPGRIKAVVDVDLPRPRDYDVMTTEPFARLKHDLLGLIHEELVRLPIGRAAPEPGEPAPGEAS